MDILDAIKKNLFLKTEYGTGPKVLNGLYSSHVLRRSMYRADGEETSDTVYEHMSSLGPVTLTVRSGEANPFKAENPEVAVTLLKVITVGNDREMWIKFKAGPKIGVLGAIPAMPAGIASVIADLDLVARAGVRFNVTRFIDDLKAEDGA